MTVAHAAFVVNWFGWLTPPVAVAALIGAKKMFTDFIVSRFKKMEADARTETGRPLIHLQKPERKWWEPKFLFESAWSKFNKEKSSVEKEPARWK